MNVSYTEDITVAGSLLASHVQDFCNAVVGKSNITEIEWAKYNNLLKKVEKVQLIDRFGSKSPTYGTLYITTTHLIFVADEGNSETWVLHSLISFVEKGQLTAAGCPLTIRCKNFLVLSLIIYREKDCHDVYVTLSQLSQPVHIEEVYAFVYIAKDVEKNEGWDIISVDADYQRLGVPNECWALCTLNRDYSLCDTYPRNIYVPSTVPKQVLIASSKFRSKDRLPVLSYLHADTQASITRCSQPLAGFSARCVEDEEMFQHILKTNTKFSAVLYVIDTRPKVNAMANKAVGKGFENESFYTNMRFYSFAIENIHVMRSSLQKLIEVCSQKCSVTTFLNGLESSGWLKHSKMILEAANFMAESLVKGISCVVHCSDGWDRTAQTISLACLLLDPFYRTIKGFQTLVEKDWLSFGHKFSDRCGHSSQSDSKEFSPVFTQFLDCVWQIFCQFPRQFQFNERFLLTLHDHLHSCQFGTFLGNCEKDRLDLKLSERTYSLWGYLVRSTDEYLNPLYDHTLDSSYNVLKPDLRSQMMKFWTAMYNRFDNGIHNRESVIERISMAVDHIDSLEDHRNLLIKQIADLKTILGKTLKSPSMSSTMNESGFVFNAENPSPSPQSNKCAEFIHPLIMNSPANCSFDSSSQVPVKNSDSESGIEDLTISASSSVSQSCSYLPPVSVGCLGNADSGVISNTKSDSNRNNSVQNSITSLDASLLNSSLELKSVAVHWKSLRSINQCHCGVQFYHFTKKNHCCKCGNVMCSRCVENKVSLPGHLSQRLVIVCKTCQVDFT